MRFIWWLTVLTICLGILTVFEGIYIPITILKNKEYAESLDNYTIYKCNVNILAITNCSCSNNSDIKCFSYTYKFILVELNKSQINMYPCTYFNDIEIMLPDKQFCYVNNSVIELFFPNYYKFTITNKCIIGLLFPAVAISCTWSIAYSTYKKESKSCCYKKPRKDINEKELDNICTADAHIGHILLQK